MLFFLVINVEIVYILTFISWKKNPCSAELGIKFFIAYQIQSFEDVNPFYDEWSILSGSLYRFISNLGNG